MAQGRSTAIITMIKWIRTSRLSIKELSLSLCDPETSAGQPVLQIYRIGTSIQGYLAHKKLQGGRALFLMSEVPL